MDLLEEKDLSSLGDLKHSGQKKPNVLPHVLKAGSRSVL